jgi:hypothetical protein
LHTVHTHLLKLEVHLIFQSLSLADSLFSLNISRSVYDSRVKLRYEEQRR